MRIKYFFITLSIATLTCLLYTWQQVEIIRLAYKENTRKRVYRELLDTNHGLRYNLMELKSSENLGSKLLNGETDYEIPQKAQVKLLSMAGDEKYKSQKRGFLAKGTTGSVFVRIKKIWPLSLVRASLEKQAQAQDFIDRSP